MLIIKKFNLKKFLKIKFSSFFLIDLIFSIYHFFKTNFEI
jgi:hypothetical protein